MSKERMILGNNCIYSGDTEKIGINRNVLVVGESGCGKTVSYVEPILIETLRSTEPSNKIVVLTKRRLASKYMPEYEAAGFKVDDLNLAEPEMGNCSYDPMAYINSEEDISDLAHSIVMANERKEHSNADPFWDDGAEALLAAEIGIALMTKENPTFCDVLDIHYGLKFKESGSGIVTTLDPLFEKVEEIEPDCFALSNWKTFKEAAPKTAKSIYVSLNPTLRAFTEDVRECMRKYPSVDFEKFAHEKSILFITTSPVKRALHSLANIFVSQVIAELFSIADENENGELPIPVDIIFDDFATGAKVADMPEKLSICREKKIAFPGILIQSESQLQKMYGEFGACEIIDNCDTYIFMGGNNYHTARSLSLKMDVPVEEILYMPVGKIIVFRRGQSPMFSTRYDVFQDDYYKKMKEDKEKACLERLDEL